MEESGVCLVLITAPADERAGALARALVEERLAACVNLVPQIRSVYRWEGRVQEDGETLLLVKTTAAALPALERRVGELHPYELPEFLVLPELAGSAGYLGWVRDSVDGRGGG